MAVIGKPARGVYTQALDEQAVNATFHDCAFVNCGSAVDWTHWRAGTRGVKLHWPSGLKEHCTHTHSYSIPTTTIVHTYRSDAHLIMSSEHSALSYTRSCSSQVLRTRRSRAQVQRVLQQRLRCAPHSQYRRERRNGSREPQLCVDCVRSGARCSAEMSENIFWPRVNVSANLSDKCPAAKPLPAPPPGDEAKASSDEGTDAKARAAPVFPMGAHAFVSSYFVAREGKERRAARSVTHVSARRRAAGRVVADRQRAVRVGGAPELLAAGTRPRPRPRTLPCRAAAETSRVLRRCASCWTARGSRRRSSSCTPCSRRSASCTTCRTSAPTQTRCDHCLNERPLHTRTSRVCLPCGRRWSSA